MVQHRWKNKDFFKTKFKRSERILVLYSNRGKIFILGLGSNVLFKDSVFEGVIIKLGNSFSSLSKLSNDTIIAGSSCSQKNYKFTMENEISGFEYMHCIPGSVGGGIKMNSDVLEESSKII